MVHEKFHCQRTSTGVTGYPNCGEVWKCMKKHHINRCLRHHMSPWKSIWGSLSNHHLLRHWSLEERHDMRSLIAPWSVDHWLIANNVYTEIIWSTHTCIYIYNYIYIYICMLNLVCNMSYVFPLSAPFPWRWFSVFGKNETPHQSAWRPLQCIARLSWCSKFRRWEYEKRVPPLIDSGR